MSDRIIRVAPGSRASACNGKSLGGTCEATIYWLRIGDRSVPVDCSVEGGQKPSEGVDTRQLDVFGASVEIREGLGVNHALLCPDRALIAQRYAEIRERQRA